MRPYSIDDSHCRIPDPEPFSRSGLTNLRLRIRSPEAGVRATIYSDFQNSGPIPFTINLSP